jgi:transforming growth factor-beta-induced protein
MKARVFAAVAFAVVIGSAVPGPAPASETGSLYDIILSRDELSILLAAATEGKHVALLQDPGEHTMFAPTDTAFKALDDATIKKIATDKSTVQNLVPSFLVAGKITTDELKKLDGQNLPTLAGTSLRVEQLPDGSFRVGGAKLRVSDMVGSNGVMHTVDAVPPLK